MNKIRKKGLSPIISTVLLIVIVIIIAIIILSWYLSFKKEQVLKFSGGGEKSIDDVCMDVVIEPYHNEDGSFGFSNTGNIPIYAVNLRLSKNDGSVVVKRIDGQVDIGLSTIFDGYNYNDYDEVKIIPILYGKTVSGSVKEYTCPETTGVLV